MNRMILWSFCYSIVKWKWHGIQLPDLFASWLLIFAERYLYVEETVSDEEFIQNFHSLNNGSLLPDLPCVECGDVGGDILAPGQPCPTCGKYENEDEKLWMKNVPESLHE